MPGIREGPVCADNPSAWAKRRDYNVVEFSTFRIYLFGASLFVFSGFLVLGCVCVDGVNLSASMDVGVREVTPHFIPLRWGPSRNLKLD